jgi:hypothetical protein
LWPALLASTAAFSAYLALLGGGLLAIRFWHAGLPVAAAVSTVPLPTLITTALVELLLPAAGVILIGTVYALYRLYERQKGLKQRLPVVAWFIMVGFFACFLPINLYGLAALCSIFVPFLLADRWRPSIATKDRRVVVIAVVVLAIAGALPVLARQAIEPLNMERVKIERLGQPALVADLVAIKDTSVVVARCDHLIVLPTPASMRIEHLPSILGVGASIMERLGMESNNIVKPSRMPC